MPDFAAMVDSIGHVSVRVRSLRCGRRSIVALPVVGLMLRIAHGHIGMKRLLTREEVLSCGSESLQVSVHVPSASGLGSVGIEATHVSVVVAQCMDSAGHSAGHGSLRWLQAEAAPSHQRAS